MKIGKIKATSVIVGDPMVKEMYDQKLCVGLQCKHHVIHVFKDSVPVRKLQACC